ncbi:MAG: alcohol dehydrogenase catalytic domain-containing protein [Steroidobacteraceae bacterium]|nr:alcohol dehydrogenase catalytic domain-containing protein [Steroidobacteraceae bacterium]
MTSPQDQPETSIVIRAFNEERWLPEVFAALATQRYRDFEVLLVDSGSVDRTRDIAAANGARIVRLRTEDFTFGHSLNVGLSESRGRLIAIVSAHAIPADEDWLEKLVAPLRNPDVAMVYGGQRGHAISKFSEVQDFERIFPEQPRPVEASNPFANNANSAVRKDLWELHAFDEGLPGLEDIEWAIHWSHRERQIVYVPDACVIHVHSETWPQVRRRYYREAIAARWVGIRLMRHIPGEIWRELRWCGQDLWLAARQGRAASLAGEILRFRYEKTAGTIRGIVESKRLSNPARKAEVFLQQGFQALVVHGPNRVRLEERTVPSLKPGEVLVRVSHVGICGTDVEIVEGRLGYFRTGLASFPIVPGHESSGVVVALGPRVTELAEGDRVVVECIQGCGECAACRRDDAIQCRDRREVGVIGQDGACATYFVTRARYAHRIPEGVSLAQAALTEPLAVVHKGLRRLGSTTADNRPRKCMVFGAGTIGHLAARVLSARGHSVTVVDPSAERRSALDGAVATVETPGSLDGYDWLIEATGRAAVLNQLLNESRPGSTLLLLGLPYAEQNFSFESIVAFDRTVVGSVGSSAQDFREALATLPRIDTAPFLRATFPLEHYDKALATSRSQAVLKVMLTPGAPA